MSMSLATRSLPARRPLALAVSLAVLASPALAADKVLDEVQVTAAGEAPATEGYQAFSSRSSTKTDTLLRDTPQSVSVVTSQQIKDQAVQSMAEAVRYTPGVTFAQGEGNRDAAVIRGSISTGDFYLDGVRDDVQYYRDVYNIDRIEVLKGANGLAFGRGGSGGVINRVSKEANWSPVREVGVSVGSYGHKRATLDLGQGLTETVAARVNVVTEDSESYRQDVELRRTGVAPTLTLKPSERTKVVVSGEFFNDLRTADRGVPSQNGKPFRTDSKTFFGNADQSPTETTVDAFSVGIEHAFTNGVRVSNKTRYTEYDNYYQNVFANKPVSAGMVELAGYIDDTQRENFFNQTDINYRFATGAVTHDLVTGVEIGRQDTRSFRFDARFAAGCASGDKVTTVSVNSPNASAQGFDCFNRRNSGVVDVTSVYLQDTLSLGKNWQAVLGLRHDRFVTDFTTATAQAPVPVLLEATDEEVSPRAALIYKPSERVTTYLSYSESFVPRAGDQLGSLIAKTASLDPERFINKEVGVKWEPTDRLSLAAAIYRLARENVAVVLNSSGDRDLLDAQVVKGLELSATGQLTRSWSVTGGYAYADSEIGDDVVSAVSGAGVPTFAARKGNETAQTPRHTFSLWNRYDLNDRFGLGLGVISRSEMYALDNNMVTLPGYARVDAAAYYKASKNLDLQLNIENLTDRDYVVNAHNNQNITPGSPIAARLSAIYTF